MDIENIQGYQRKFEQRIPEIIINTALQHFAVLYKLWDEAGAIPHCRNLLQSLSSCLALAVIRYWTSWTVSKFCSQMIAHMSSMHTF